MGSLQVLSSGYSAQYAGVANIRVTTRSGTDKYHGTAYYDNVNSALSAWALSDKLDQETFSPTAFAPVYVRPQTNNTDMAFSFGGPVPKVKKTWMFLAYEEQWNVSPTTESGNVAHPTLLTGDFSLMNDATKPQVPANIVLTPSEIATDTVGGLGQQFITIPQRLINPVTTKLIDAYFPQIGDQRTHQRQHRYGEWLPDDRSVEKWPEDGRLADRSCDQRFEPILWRLPRIIRKMRAQVLSLLHSPVLACSRRLVSTTWFRSPIRTSSLPIW